MRIDGLVWRLSEFMDGEYSEGVLPAYEACNIAEIRAAPPGWVVEITAKITARDVLDLAQSLTPGEYPLYIIGNVSGGVLVTLYGKFQVDGTVSRKGIDPLTITIPHQFNLHIYMFRPFSKKE